MKKFLALLIVPLLLLGLSSCGTTASVAGGLNDEAYLVVASSGKYLGQKVEVLIDEVSGDCSRSPRRCHASCEAHHHHPRQTSDPRARPCRPSPLR